MTEHEEVQMSEPAHRLLLSLHSDHQQSRLCERAMLIEEGERL
jgi:hypothetical protein